MLSEKNWRPDAVGRLMLGIVVSVMVGIILSDALQPLLRGLNTADVQLIQFAIATASFQGATLVLVGVFLRAQHLSWADAFGLGTAARLGRTLGLTAATSLIILVGGLVLGSGSAELMRWCGLTPEPQLAVQIVETTESPLRTSFFGLVAVVLAPAAEEVLFRGLIYPTLKQMGHRQVALWLTSVLFAASHFSMLAFIPLVFVALMLTLLYETTNNLLAPIVAHSLFNLTNLFLLIFEGMIAPMGR
ncbi:MAG: CPBP family intramembrane metalloprotease [Candidatus Omnitrophica bacterium]|nr:CPBP family intramembrane metalloprotease [Candidatus Omnitrophota bacterium]